MAEPEEDTEVKNEKPETEGEGAEGEASEDEASEGKKAKLRLSPKKLAIVAVPLLVLLGAGGYFGRDYLPFMGSGESSAAAVTPKVYYNLPEMVVNLSSKDTRAQYLKLKVSLEAKDQQVIDSLNPIMPRVLDMFQLYLRELRSSDLEGSAGIYRLKEELLRRINIEIHPNRINRVLFNEIIIQ
ncbi:flagellar FliL protein [bacterium BMS3Bbin10]|nr:flagellar FliL protein [bacterium BMS3Bbin10]